ncbi:hypothetical protein CS053_17370 [Rhodanobacter glycinis]|uniref:Uncharacterized protein n=1 Tax=Rhodanobacter glycinis TaxID=582702 RepID=A0A5B9E4S9_9GAMM|nr:hypothetical protein CS053_17370 [Rhodanobacter glycinis]
MCSAARACGWRPGDAGAAEAPPAGASIGAPAGKSSTVRPVAEANTAERGFSPISFQLPSGNESPWRTRTSVASALSPALLSRSNAMRSSGVRMMPVSSRSPRLTCAPPASSMIGLRSLLNNGCCHTAA